MKYKFFNNKNGQLLIEVLVGIALFVIGVGSSALLVSGGSTVSRDRTDSIRARSIAREGIEATRGVFFDNWDAISDGTHGLIATSGVWAFSSSSDMTDGFKREVTITSSGTIAKDIVGRVSWSAVGGRERDISFTTRLTDWRTALSNNSSSGECGVLSGDWSNPVSAGSYDLGSGRSGTDIAVTSSIAYVSSVASSESKNDFSTFDVSMPSSPQLLGDINTGGGINGFVLHNGYVFAVSDDDSSEFLVIDVSNPSIPTEVASINLSGSGNANALDYYNGFVMVGRSYSHIYDEMEVIDVSDPESPVRVSGWDTSASILTVRAFQDKVYYGYYNITNDVGVRDISSLPETTFLGSWNIGTDDVYSIRAVGDENNFYLGGDFGELFYAGDGTSATNFDVYDSIDAEGAVWDFIISGNYAFLGTDDSNGEFKIIDVSSTSSLSHLATLNFSQIATGVACENNHIFVSVRSNDGLQIITSQ